MVSSTDELLAATEHKMSKHYELTITDDSFIYRRKPDSVAREARLDGLYVIRTSLPAETLSAEAPTKIWLGWSGRSDR